MKITTKYIALITMILLATTTLSATDYYRMKNRWTGEYLHIQNKKGHTELAKKIGGWWSAQWSIENTSAGYFRIKNRWTGEYLHIENKRGFLELDKSNKKNKRGDKLQHWWSSQWKKVNVEKGYFRLQNKWTKEYMHIEGKLGHVQLNKKGPSGGWWSSQWKLEKVTPTNYTLFCRAGKNMGLNYLATTKSIAITFKAGKTGTKHGALNQGECSWGDRAFRANEPRKICQSNVKDIVLKINARSFSATSRQAPYISKIKNGGTFSMKVRNDNHGCMVVKKVLP